MNTPKWLKWDEEAIKSLDRTSDMYKYIYGAKDIQVKYREFKPSSVYVSKPFTIDGNVVEVSLSTEEYNASVSSLSKKINPYDTSIEYYITFKEAFDPEDEEAWVPILPNGQELIENELLVFKGSPIAKLRFHRDINKETTVYKNGVKLENQYWSYGKDNTIRIDKRFDKYAIYTIRYYPDLNVRSPWDVELPEESRRVESFLEDNPPKDSLGQLLYGEIFTSGADRNGSVLLSKTPYIDYAKINSDPSYRPIDVYLMPNTGYYGNKNPDGSISGPNKTQIKTEIGPLSSPVKTKNMTDYKYRIQPVIAPYDTSLGSNSQPLNPNFEFYQEGRRLYFTETFNNTHIFANMETNHGDAEIRVRYDYLKTTVRLKIILRNTSNKDDAITPILKGYNLVFKVMR